MNRQVSGSWVFKPSAWLCIFRDAMVRRSPFLTLRLEYRIRSLPCLVKRVRQIRVSPYWLKKTPKELSKRAQIFFSDI